MSILSKILNSGISCARGRSEKRSIFLSNALSLILFGFGLIFFFLYYFWYGWGVITPYILVCSTLCLTLPVLNGLRLSELGRIMICSMIPIAAIGLSVQSKIIYYGQTEELDYFTFRFILLASCILPMIFFSFRERNFLLGTSVLNFFALMSYDPIHILAGVPYSKGTLKIYNYYFVNAVVFITYCVSIGSVFFLKWISERNEEKADQLIEDMNQINIELLEKNTEIERTSQEVSAQASILEESQLKLKGAYRLIEEQKDLLEKQNKNLEGELIVKNRELVQTNAELIKHNNELRQFSYTVSHNLRGPVASLLGLVSLLDKTSAGKEDEVVFHIKKAGEQLDAIVKDLNQIIDIRHDIFIIRQKIHFEREVGEVLKLLERDLKSHQVRVEMDLRKCPYVFSVKPMVHSILYNLISNGIKYRSSERTPVIRIESEESDEYYSFTVTDNGLGIDLEQFRESLFRLYKRFHFHTEGKGLGLYLVKLQTEALGGYVEVDSEINRFTAFTIHLKKPSNIERQILLQENFAEIFYDGKINCIGTIWNGSITSEQYRMVYKKCLEFVKVYNTPNFLADFSRQGDVAPEDLSWMLTDILPEAARNGLSRIAGVYPPGHEYHQENLPLISGHLINNGLQQDFFGSIAEACDWLQTENEKASLKLIRSDG